MSDVLERNHTFPRKANARSAGEYVHPDRLCAGICSLSVGCARARHGKEQLTGAVRAWGMEHGVDIKVCGAEFMGRQQVGWGNSKRAILVSKAIVREG